MISLVLLGGAAIESNGERFTGPATQRHRLALLSLLAASHPRAFTREKLIGYLWPDAPQARHLLKQSVYVLRRALGEATIVSAGDDLVLSAAALDCDLIAFGEALTAGELEHAVRLYAGPFLDGFLLPGSPEFEQWVDGERERLRLEYCDALEQLAQSAVSAGEPKRASDWWRRRAAIDPHNARVTLRLMESLAASGDRAAALHQARLHAVLLQEHFDAEPDPAVEALAERLRAEPVSDLDSARAPTPTETAHEVRFPSRAAAPGIPTPAIPAPVQQTTRAPARWAARYATAASIFLLLLVISAALWRGHPGRAQLDPTRVVVMPLDNHTGAPEFEPIGKMAADWITQGLAQTAMAGVVTSTAALASAWNVRGLVAESANTDPVRAMAEETGAALVVYGSYYQLADSLRFQLHIADARRGRVLHALQPVNAPASDPMPAITALQQAAVAALARFLDDRSEPYARAATMPPTYEAYRAFAEGADLFAFGKYQASIELFARAAAADSTYKIPLLHVAIARGNLLDFAAMDSILRDLAPFRDRFGSFERALLDQMIAHLHSDAAGRYEATRRTARIAPGTLPHVQWGIEATRALNRPRETLSILSQIDPARGNVRGWAPYWIWLTNAHHVLGEHRRELRAARRARALEPHRAEYLGLEARALAALRRVRDVERLVEQSLTFMDDPTAPATELMVLVADELNQHGNPEQARRMYERALALHRSLPQSNHVERIRHARALLFVAEDAEAEVLLRQITEEDPDHITANALLGVIAARRADRKEAARISAWLERQRPPYRLHQPLYLRAVIAAQLGERQQATDLLREALKSGLPYGDAIHSSPSLDPIRDYPPFRELLRPKG